MSSRKRRHHYFPVFNLRLFTSPQEVVWVHDKDGRLAPNPKALHPRVAGVEQELYTITGDEGERSDEIENWLAEAIDGPASGVFPKLLAGDQLSREERSRIAAYIMSRDLRTPSARAFVMSNAQRRFKAEYERRVRDFESVRKGILDDGGPYLTDEEIKELGDATVVELTPNYWLDFLSRHVNGGGARLYGCGWLLVRAPEGVQFITSDIGILKHRNDFGTPVAHMIGWWNLAGGWLVPLSPGAALLIAPGLEEGVADAHPEWVRAVNVALASQAHRFIFAAAPAGPELGNWLRDPTPLSNDVKNS